MKKTSLKLSNKKIELEYKIDESIDNIIFLNKYVKKNHFLYETKKEIYNLNKNKGIKKYITQLIIKFKKKELKIINNHLKKHNEELLKISERIKSQLEFSSDINNIIFEIETIAENAIKNICIELKQRYTAQPEIFYKYILDYASFNKDKEKKEAIGIIIKNITEIIK